MSLNSAVKGAGDVQRIERFAAGASGLRLHEGREQVSAPGRDLGHVAAEFGSIAHAIGRLLGGERLGGGGAELALCFGGSLACARGASQPWLRRVWSSAPGCPGARSGLLGLLLRHSLSNLPRRFISHCNIWAPAVLNERANMLPLRRQLLGTSPMAGICCIADLPASGLESAACRE